MEAHSTFPARNGGKIWLTKTAHRWIPTEITKKNEKKKKERKRDKRGTVGEGVAGSRGATNINNVAKLKMFTVRYVWYEGHERGSRVPRDWSRVSSSLPLTTGCFLWILLWYGVARRPSPFHGVPSRRTDRTRSVSIPLRIKSNPPPSLPPSRPSLLLGVLDPRARHVQARKSSSRNVARRFNCPRIFVQSLLHVFGSCMYVDDRDLKGCLKRGAARIELCREKERERGSVCIYIVFSRESFWEICQLMMLENKQVIYI